MKYIVSIMLIVASFSAFSEDWDAMGNPTNNNKQPVERQESDMSGDWDAMGNPR